MKKSILIIAVILNSIALLSSCITREEKEVEKKEYNQEEYKKVEAAILDYVEALYLVDSTRIDKSVDTKLRKIGYWYHPDQKQFVDNLEMTHEQLSNLAARWNKSGNQVNEKSPKEIEIFDVNSKIASAKLTAAWGIDLFHLAKVDGQWKIMNVIWQSLPNEE